MMNRDMTISQRVTRAADSCELEKVLATHNYLHAASRSYEEWTTVWSKREDTSWAHSFGRMRGFPSIWMGSVVDYDQQCIDNYRQIEANYPEVAGMDYRPLYNNAMHMLTNGVLEVADDGKTARASYLTPGLLYSFLNDDQKPWGAMLWERYGMDFVKEEDGWKFLHYQVCPEFFDLFDVFNPAEMMYHNLKNNVPPPPNPTPSNLDDPGPLHMECNPIQPVQKTCPPPLPYRTMNNRNSYTHFDCYEDEARV